MNYPCPECGAVYAVSDRDIGRRIACKKCNTALEVTENELKRVDDFGAPKDDDRARERDEPRGHEDDDDRGRRRNDDDDDDRGRKRDRDDDSGGRSKGRRGRDDDDEGGRSSKSSRREREGVKAGEMFKKLKALADVSTWLFSIGLVLTVYAFFSPKIDHAKSLGRLGDAEAAQADDDDEDLDFRQKEKPDESDRKDHEARHKKYETYEKKRLDIKERYAKASEKKTYWWARIFGLIGFLLLAFGSLGYLSQTESQTKRIVGVVTILIILFQVIMGSSAFMVQLGGGAGVPPG